MPEPTDKVSQMAPYTVSESAKLSNDDKGNKLKLDWNESTFPPSPQVRERLYGFVENGHFEYYPDVTAKELREKLAEYVGCGVENLQVFNGSDDALRAIVDTYLGQDDVFLAREPVYTQPYTFVETNGANRITFTCESPFEKGVNRFLTVLEETQPKVTYLPNPNNPTGVCYSQEEIEELLSAAPDTLFIVDEAYYEYADTTVSDSVSEYDNLVVCRTFSKAFGLASCRIGYTVASEEIIRELEKVRNGKSVNLFGQIAASAALDDIEYMRDCVRTVIETREWLVESLRSRGYSVVSTPANFVLVEVDNPKQTIESLKREGIYVRNRDYLPQLDGYIRVSIGDREQMQTFLNAFETVTEKSRAD